MPSFDTLATFSFAAFLLCIAPGPSNLYIMARSISQGHKAGFTAGFGMALDSFIYVIVSAFGLAAIFTYLPWAFTLIKLLGAGYLIYLALHYLRLAKSTSEQIKGLQKLSYGVIFKQSLLVELTNPKTALFFIAFLPLFTKPEQSTITLQLLILGGLYAVIGLLCDLFVATLSGSIGSWMNSHPKSQQWQNRISALLLLAIAGFIIYQEFLIFYSQST